MSMSMSCVETNTPTKPRYARPHGDSTPQQPKARSLFKVISFRRTYQFNKPKLPDTTISARLQDRASASRTPPLITAPRWLGPSAAGLQPRSPSFGMHLLKFATLGLAVVHGGVEPDGFTPAAPAGGGLCDADRMCPEATPNCTGYVFDMKRGKCTVDGYKIRMLATSRSGASRTPTWATTSRVTTHRVRQPRSPCAPRRHGR